MSLASTYRQTLAITLGGETLTIAPRQVTNPSRVSLISEQLGLTKGTVIIEARLVTPLRLPATVKAGATGILTWAGRAGVARLEPYQGAIVNAWRDRYGDKLLLTWTTDEIP